MFASAEMSKVELGETPMPNLPLLSNLANSLVPFWAVNRMSSERSFNVPASDLILLTPLE